MWKKDSIKIYALIPLNDNRVQWKFALVGHMWANMLKLRFSSPSYTLRQDVCGADGVPEINDWDYKSYIISLFCSEVRPNPAAYTWSHLRTSNKFFYVRILAHKDLRFEFRKCKDTQYVRLLP